LTLAGSILVPPCGANSTFRRKVPETLSGVTSLTPGPRVMARVPDVAAEAGSLASSAVTS
jgi:hypothetical protein